MNPCSTRRVRRAHDERADRHLASALERGEKRALGASCRASCRASPSGARSARDASSSRPNLNRDRALPRGREPCRRVEIRGDALRRVEAVQARRREDRRVHVAFVDLPDARRHVAAELDDLEIGARRVQLRAATETRRADARPRRQIVERLGADDAVDDEHVARILARQQRDDLEARRDSPSEDP